MTQSYEVIGLVRTPSGQMDQLQLEDNGDRTINLRYDPREEGEHEFQVSY